ncbi:hypothetical protein A1O1_09020 [Capronia coronata CBS 617.96]|uniref:Uncharacterized protein n=1 Tax=Capronia coronata CBS 617.96 TaxID=1182541 RepID=W9Y886_9EURO|nr:uncharacterized protein A1O1_09020 [Capronia coronata CBS 617.96]EXJ78619.1 hypothetical protein A1O1_09020 [Capronia coronata CBS 617.96]
MSSTSVSQQYSGEELEAAHDTDLSYMTSFSGSTLTLEEELADVSDNTFTDAEIGNNNEYPEEDQGQTAERQPEQHQPSIVCSIETCHRHHNMSFVRLNEAALEKWRRDLEALGSSEDPIMVTEADGATHPTAIDQLFKHALAMYNWMTDSVAPYMVALEADKEALQHENKNLTEHINLLQDHAEELLEAYSTEYETRRLKTAMLEEVVDMVGNIAERIRTL